MKRARVSLGVLALAALVLGGCEVGTESHRGAREELRHHREQWARQGVRDYAYVVRNTCYCSPEWQGPVRVEVRGGQAVSSTYLSTGEPASLQAFGLRDTVEDLFDTVAQALYASPHRVDVRYDPQLGYPVSAHFDYQAHTTDDENGFVVEGFQVLR